MSDSERVLRLGGAVVALAVLLGLGFTLFSSFEPDDTHITYWEAYSIAHFGRIQDYNGAAVEPSSSLAHAALTALVHLLTGVSVPTVGVLLPAVFAALATLLAGVLTARVAPRFAVVGALVVATTPWLLAWSFGGLDAPIAAAALVALVVAAADCVERPTRGRWLAVAGALLLLLTARPEGGLVALATLLGAAALAIVGARRRGEPLRAAAAPYAKVGAILLGEAGALFAFRRLSFGVWMPNPVYAKADALRPTEGLAYIVRHTGFCASWIFLGLVFALFVHAGAGWRARRPASGPGAAASALGVAASLATVGFVATSGGDWMSRGRLLVPLAPVAVPIILAAIERILPRPRPDASALARFGPVAVVVLAALALDGGAARELESTSRHSEISAYNAGDMRRKRRAIHAEFPDRDYGFFEISSRKHLQDIYLAGALDRVLVALAPIGRPVLVATREAGFVPYYAAVHHRGQVHVVDLLNLATADVRLCAPNLVRRTRDDPMAGWSYARGVDYPELLERTDVFGPCGLSPPDVIFDIGNPNDVLESSGYRVVYRQYDANHSYIALRVELAEKYGVVERRFRL